MPLFNKALGKLECVISCLNASVDHFIGDRKKGIPWLVYISSGTTAVMITRHKGIRITRNVIMRKSVIPT